MPDKDRKTHFRKALFTKKPEIKVMYR